MTRPKSTTMQPVPVVTLTADMLVQLAERLVKLEAKVKELQVRDFEALVDEKLEAVFELLPTFERRTPDEIRGTVRLPMIDEAGNHYSVTIEATEEV